MICLASITEGVNCLNERGLGELILCLRSEVLPEHEYLRFICHKKHRFCVFRRIDEDHSRFDAQIVFLSCLNETCHSGTRISGSCRDRYESNTPFFACFSLNNY